MAHVGVVLGRLTWLLAADGDLEHARGDETGVAKDFLELEARGVTGRRPRFEEMGGERDPWRMSSFDQSLPTHTR